MAFCPECGKPVTADAVNCQACGHELPVEAKRAAAARRFNETVVMASPISMRPDAPANVNAPSSSAAASHANTLKQSAPAASAAQARGSLKAAKATMLGTGGSPIIARAVSVGAPSAEATLAAAPSEAVQALSAAVEVAETLRPPEAAAANANSDALRLREDPNDVRLAPASLRLRTDPRADDPALMPAEVLDSGALPRHVEAGAVLDKEYARESQLSAAPVAGRSARLRLADDEEGPLTVPKGERVWVYWAACGVVVVSVMLLAYGFGLFW